MRKYLQVLIVLGFFFAAVAFRHFRGPVAQPPVAASPEHAKTPTASGPTIPPTPIAATQVAPTPTPPVPAPTAIPTSTPTVTVVPTVIRLVAKAPSLFDGPTFRDGAFTGKEVRTTYGMMQVQVVIREGRISDVVAVQVPRRTTTSTSISEKTLPEYIGQAIAIEDWDVDLISGATVTWNAFKKAMVYALRAAE